MGRSMNLLRRFRRDQNGTMTMEFAIVAPLLFIIIIAGFEFFDAFKSYGRAAKVTYTIADNLSRREKIDEAKITELHALMDALLPWMNGPKTLVVSSITYNDTDGYVCEWSKPSVVNQSTMGIEFDFNLAAISTLLNENFYKDVLPSIAVGDSVILVETVVEHRTLFSMFGLRGLKWHNQVAIRPRFTSRIVDESTPAQDCNV